MVGGVSNVMVTSSGDVGQLKPLIDHLKTLVPSERLLTVEAGLEGSVTVPPPLTTVQLPVPTTGVFPARVAVDVQIVWLGPASAVVGGLNTVMVRSSDEAAQVPLLIVQRKTLAPNPKPVTVEAWLVGVVMVAVPETTVQLPVPVVGMLAASTVEFVQIF
jgi:hypothetical protein